MSGLMKGLNVSTVWRNRRLLLKKKKSSPCGPHFPGTFHSMEAVRKHTLSIGSRWGQKLFQTGFSHKLWKKPAPAIGGRSLNKVLGPTNPLARILHTLQGFVQCHDRVFEVLFPHTSNPCSLSLLDVVFAVWIIQTNWLPSFSKGLSFVGFHSAS